MSEKSVNDEVSHIKKNVLKKDGKGVYEKYQQIQTYEHHFNNLETEIRKLGSVWLLVALGAIAYLVKGSYLGDLNVPMTMMNPKILISIVSLMGNFGLLVLWMLDQMVYHRLLNAVFLLGLRMEYLHRDLPPIRTLMMLFSRKRGMARYLRWYYYVPMLALGGISLISSSWYVYESKNQLSLIIGLIPLLIPAYIYWKSKRMERYEEIAEGFDDPKFVNYLAEKDYEKILHNH